MAIESEILQAGNILDGAANVVNKGLSIFDSVRQTFFPVGMVPTSDPAGEMSGQQQIAGPKPSLPTNTGLLIVAAIAVYLLVR